MKTNLLENENYIKGHPQYRRAYLVNSVFLLLFFTTVMFTVFNLMIKCYYIVLVINIFTALLSITSYILFRKIRNVELFAYIAVMLVTLSVGSFILAVGNEHFGLMWLCVYPPVVYFLLGRNKGRIITISFNLIIFVHILISSGNWVPVGFTTESLSNITGSIFSLIMLISFYEQNRQDFSKKLEDKTTQLKLILDSTDNAIFGISENDICTFCNKSAVDLLGFNNETEILGSNISTLLGKHIELNKSEDLFFGKNNVFFYAEYAVRPYIVNSLPAGRIITLRDITGKKADSDKMRHLSTHDSLTGLYNRFGFDEKVKELDSTGLLPVTVIFCDVNNLKMANDIFGHKAGDQLLYNCSMVIREIFNTADVIARIGGDEFVVLLSGKEENTIDKKILLVKERISDADFFALKSGISIGYDIKTNMYQNIETVLGNAETNMYKDKIKTRKDLDVETLKDIVFNLHKKSYREKIHSQNVAKYCRMIASALGLDAAVVDRAARAGYYHDIGKIILPEEILISRKRSSPEERKIYFQHPAAGYRILSLTDMTLDLADSVYLHHERWDGKGFPKGLKEDEIPLIARIIAVAESYDELTNFVQDDPLTESVAMAKLEEDPGKLDPKIVKVFMDIKKN